MVEYGKKYYFVRVNESWFSYTFKMIDLVYCKAYMDIKNGKRPPFVIKKISHTVENSLDKNKDEIYAGFSKNIRIGIRKAEESGIVTSFNYNVCDFVKFYNSFAEKKGIPLISERRLLELGDHLLIGFATFNGKILAAQSYLIDCQESIVRVFWACSSRLEEDVDEKMPGWANKLLFYKSMMYFKSQGIRVYDWGGYALNTKDEQLMGINNFKVQFGGTIVSCCNYLSVTYVLLHLIANSLDLLGNIY